MKQFYYLSSCSTCKKIMSALDLTDFDCIDIKENGLTLNQIEKMKSLAGSYEDLFSRRAQLYRTKGLKDVELTEQDYKNYLLEHYTFLKRPVLIDENEIYIGNSPKNKKVLLEKYGK